MVKLNSKEADMKENYQLLLDNIIKENEKNDYAPTLLLHSCCGPCRT